MNARIRTFAALIFALAIILYFFWNRQPPFSRAEANAFCENIIGRVSGEQTSLPEDLRLGPGKGQYATFEFTPRQNFPTEIEGLPVQDPRFWLVVLKIYERSEWPNQDKIRYVGCPTFVFDYSKILEKATTLERQKYEYLDVFGGADLWTQGAGFSGEPEDPIQSENPWGHHWTFFATPHDSKPGDEFVYELVLFPHAHRASALRTMLGPSVVLRCGLITVDSNSQVPQQEN